MRAFVIIATLLIAACASLVPKPTLQQVETAQVRWPETTFEDLDEGRRLYVRRCSSCHNLHPPTDYTVDEWPKALAEMGREYAKLEPAQEQLVLRYLISVLETPPPPPDVHE